MYNLGDLVVRTDPHWMPGYKAEIVNLQRRGRGTYRVKVISNDWRNGETYGWSSLFFKRCEDTRIVWEV